MNAQTFPAVFDRNRVPANLITPDVEAAIGKAMMRDACQMQPHVCEKYGGQYVPADKLAFRQRVARQMHADGSTCAAIGAVLGVDAYRVKIMLGGMGLEPRAKTRRLAVSQVAGLNAAGMRVEGIAEYLEVSVGMIRMHMAKNGIIENNGGKPREWTDERVEYLGLLWEYDTSLVHMARLTGMTQDEVIEKALELGLINQPKGK